MVRTRGAVDARLRCALIVLLGGTGGHLLLSLLGTTGSPSVVMLLAMAVSVTAVVAPARLHVAPAQGTSGRTLRRAGGVPVFLAGRVTDTARHPVRPRAPGLV